jgi:hypothetical protein
MAQCYIGSPTCHKRTKYVYHFPIDCPDITNQAHFFAVDLIAMVASNLATTGQIEAFQCEVKLNIAFGADVENRLNLYRSLAAQDQYIRLSEARKRVIQDEILPPNGPPLLRGDRLPGAHSSLGAGGALYNGPGARSISFGGHLPPRPEKTRKPHQSWSSNGSESNAAGRGSCAPPSRLSKGSIPVRADTSERSMALPRAPQMKGVAQTHATRPW